MRILALFLSLLVAAPAMAQAREVPAAFADENILNLDLSTGGRVVILLRPDIAPGHVERIRTLANSGFYDGIVFHRVIPGMMAQTGDPLGNGTGGSQLPDLEAEFSKVPHLRGTVSMARASGDDSANSQFFIAYQPFHPWDGKYTVFGRVFSGMAFVDAIAPGEPPRQPSRILQARTGRNVPAPSEAQTLAAANAAMPNAARDEDGAERSMEELLSMEPNADTEAETLLDPS